MATDGLRGCLASFGGRVPWMGRIVGVGIAAIFVLLAVWLAGYLAPVAAWSQTADTARDVALRQTQMPASDAQQPPPVMTARDNEECYGNNRFGFDLCFPAGIFTAQPAPENNDGRTFVSRDGRIELLVWGGHNALNRTLAQAFTEAKQEAGLAVTYQAMKNDWYVVSGYLDGKILYQKTWLRGDVFYNLRLVYAESAREQADPILRAVVKSFRF
ncbi:hypothetical protein GTA51_18010 [Desulfovibrio aerotolerans]|uniref:Uncharacterized protein n=1 Tax=Solidesulfovibrio aerotolerans TaxID=295255 RepID=A0A7C9MLC8_9BACT|nr:hypothetical protein [Solidesulfovibrio aerotolerans]MYL85009.1 hypothetical protein [Solidesulfovibrio aerotolerans]